MDPETAFTRHITESPGVCNNCFSRTHLVVDDWYPETIPNSTQSILQDRLFVVDRTTTERIYPPIRTADADDDRSPLLNYPPSRNICRCGSIDGKTTIRPLSTQEMIERTHNIVDRLDEADVTFDEDTLYDTVRSLKSDPGEQFADDQIFERAIEAAISTIEPHTDHECPEIRYSDRSA